MYCNIIIPVYFQDDRATVVVTELEYSPEQRRTFHSEAIPERLEVAEGYAVDEEGNDLDFDEVLKENTVEVFKHCLEWYKEDLTDYDS